MSLYNELKRRNVFRVAIAYLAGAWLLIEVSSILFPAFGIPDWGVRFVVVLLGFGFVPALIISWAYELTPEGLKREKDVVHDKSIAHLTAKRLDGITIGIIVVALAFILADRVWLSSGFEEQVAAPVEVVTKQNATEPEVSAESGKSIAVLPFVNISDDPGNEYFSDGISEELLNVLFRVKGLRVVSRTSSFAFKGKGTSIPDIARALNVSHVLEGSVRKAGNTIRVTAQLIEVRTDSHIWSGTYDRELEDIFAIQDEISGQIVQALKIALGVGEQEAMARVQKSTENLAAYELYLRGRYALQRRGQGDNLRRAIDLFQQATKLDPQFARAWSSLAAAHMLLPNYSDASAAEQYPPAVSAAQQALMLDDSLAEAYAVLGDMARVDRKWQEAEAYYLRAIASEPKNSTAHVWYGEFYVMVGRLRDALEHFRIAYQLDPLHPVTNKAMAAIYFFLDDTDNALKYGTAAWDLGHLMGLNILARAHLRRGENDRALEFAEQYDDRVNHPILKLSIAAKTDANPSPMSLELLAEHETKMSLRASLQIYTAFGRIDDAYRLVNMNRDPGRFGYLWAIWQPEMAPFRQDPRFAELVTDLGLVDYWRENSLPDVCQLVGDSVICE